MTEKQGPPLDLAQTIVNGENNTVHLDTTYVGKQPKPGTNPAGGGFRVPPTRPGGMGSGITHTEGLRRETRDKRKSHASMGKKRLLGEVSGFAEANRS